MREIDGFRTSTFQSWPLLCSFDSAIRARGNATGSVPCRPRSSISSAAGSWPAQRAQRRRSSTRPRARRAAPCRSPATDEVGQAVAAARKAALPAWAMTTPLRRARILNRFLRLLEDRTDELAAVITAEHGKVSPTRWARCSAASRWSSSRPARRSCSRARSPRTSARGVDSHSLRQPLGRRRRHHAVQLPGHGADVDVPGGARLRQLLHPQAVRARSLGVADPGRAAEGGRPARRRVQRRPRRQGGGRRAPAPSRTSRRSASSARPRSRSYIYETGGRARQARARRWAAPRTT